MHMSHQLGARLLRIRNTGKGLSAGSGAKMPPKALIYGRKTLRLSSA